MLFEGASHSSDSFYSRGGASSFSDVCRLGGQLHPGKIIPNPKFSRSDPSSDPRRADSKLSSFSKNIRRKLSHSPLLSCEKRFTVNGAIKIDAIVHLLENRGEGGGKCSSSSVPPFFFFFFFLRNAVKSLSYWYFSISGKGMSRRNGWAYLSWFIWVDLLSLSPRDAKATCHGRMTS